MGTGIRDRAGFVAQVKFALGGALKTLYITSVHLTAYEQYPLIRKVELERLIAALKQSQHVEQSASVMILGDFNFHSEDETSSIPPDYFDVWLKLRGLVTSLPPGEERTAAKPSSSLGYTYDPLFNVMIPRVYPPETRRMRLDRVIMNAESTASLPHLGIEKFADDPIPTTAGVREGTFPSDHFGLCVRLCEFPCVETK